MFWELINAIAENSARFCFALFRKEDTIFHTTKNQESTGVINFTLGTQEKFGKFTV